MISLLRTAHHLSVALCWLTRQLSEGAVVEEGGAGCHGRAVPVVGRVRLSQQSPGPQASRFLLRWCPACPPILRCLSRLFVSGRMGSPLPSSGNPVLGLLWTWDTHACGFDVTGLVSWGSFEPCRLSPVLARRPH